MEKEKRRGIKEGRRGIKEREEKERKTGSGAQRMCHHLSSGRIP